MMDMRGCGQAAMRPSLPAASLRARTRRWLAAALVAQQQVVKAALGELGSGARAGRLADAHVEVVAAGGADGAATVLIEAQPGLGGLLAGRGGDGGGGEAGGAGREDALVGRHRDVGGHRLAEVA